MNEKKKRIMLWILALFITLGAAVYQKLTGPTYPKKEKVEIDGKTYNFKLLRSWGGNENCTYNIELSSEIKGKIYYRKYPTSDEWTSVELTQNEGVMQIELPYQPPAGKIEYYFEFMKDNNSYFLNKEEPVVIRFKGDVPAYILVPHIIFMFFAMFLANVSGLFAIANVPQFKRYAIITLVALFIGGLILGPIVQKFAFNEYWAGIPFGWDLTDNKTLIGFIVWGSAVLLTLKKERKWAVVIASIVILIVFSIPHSMHGSELNYETGTIEQG